MRAKIIKWSLFLTLIISKVDLIACDCEKLWTIEESVANIGIIFSGKIISKTITQNYDSLGVKAVNSTSLNPWFTKLNVFYRIKVDRILKGKLLSDTITVISNEGNAACEAVFDVGSKYIIYAYFDKDFIYTKDSKCGKEGTNSLWTNTCLRNTPWYEDSIDEENYIIKLANIKK